MQDDPFADRKRLTFEQAEGAEAVPSQLALGEVSPRLRSALWRVVHDAVWESRQFADYARHATIGDPWRTILRNEFVYRQHKMADEFSYKFDDQLRYLKELFSDGGYIEIFGWVQWVLRHPSVPHGFHQPIEGALRIGQAAYRVLDGKTIVPIGSDQELAAVKRAFADVQATEFNGARSHLQAAASQLTEGKFAASIRESIHAVESVARVLEPTGDFSKALAKLESKIAIHGALRSGFGSIYGFTSDEEGLRHPLLDTSAAKVDEADALFMLGACAAFVSYLINKARMTGLISPK